MPVAFHPALTMTLSHGWRSFRANYGNTWAEFGASTRCLHGVRSSLCACPAISIIRCAVTKRQPCQDIRGTREHQAGRDFFFSTGSTWPVGACREAQDRKGGPQAMDRVQGDADGRTASTAIECRISSSCAAGDCVAVARLPTGHVLVTDTKDPSGPQLRFDPSEWRAFVAGVRAGDFDD